MVRVKFNGLDGERALKKFGNCSISFSDEYLNTGDEEEIIVSKELDFPIFHYFFPSFRIVFPKSFFSTKKCPL